MDTAAKIAEIDRKIRDYLDRHDLEPHERDECIDRLLERRYECR